MKKIFIPLLYLVLLLEGCKQETTIVNDLQYEEKLVVRSILTAGQPVRVYFSKTVPISGSYNPDDFIVKDVKASIVNEDSTYNLAYTDSGYYTSPGLVASNGETYNLTANWNGKQSTSQTTVSYSTQYQNAKLIADVSGTDTTYSLQCLLTPSTGAVYGVTWLIINADSVFRLEDTVIPELLREQDKNLQNLLILKTRSIPTELVNKWRRSFFIRIHAFDSQYYNFFLTQNSNSASTNVFNQGNLGLRWNVKGGGIGMFIGETDFIVKVNL
jgi:hypothetical protein